MVYSDSIKGGGTSGLSIGSPKDKFVDFFFNQFGCYTEVMRTDDDERKLDRATAALLAICPDIQKREALFTDYTTKKKSENVTSASVTLAGNFMSYISETLEFTEKSYGSVF